MNAAFQNLEVYERPRERLALNGPGLLSDIELMALLLGSGRKGKDVFRLAKEVIRVVDMMGEDLDVAELKTIDGIGTAKATLIIAALEFSRRRIRPKGIKIRTAADIYPLVRHLGDRKQEVVIVISLNGAHEVIATRVVTIGLVNRSQIHPREVFADVIVDRAASIVVAHNHPSGELKPSPQDIEATRVLKDAGALLGIGLLDHVIFGEEGWVSLAEMRLV